MAVPPRPIFSIALAPMLLLIAFAGGIISGIATTALTVRALGRRAVLDVPNLWSSHTSPTIRGGGIGLATGTLVALAIAHGDLGGSTGIALAIAGLGFGAIGLLDDLTSALPAMIRLVLLQHGISADGFSRCQSSTPSWLESSRRWSHEPHLSFPS